MIEHGRTPVQVINPRKIPLWSLPAERIAISPGCKPSMALLPDGRLVMVGMVAGPEGEKLPPGRIREWTGIWWSEDGGKSWTGMKRIADMIGREQWITCASDGTLFASSHHLENDITNEDGVILSWLHRSTDGGETWQRTRATIDGELRCGERPAYGTHTSRNVIELGDGTLLFGVSICNTKVAYLWKSTDGGKTWDKTRRVTIGEPYESECVDFFSEGWDYVNDSGVFLHWLRVGGERGMAPMKDGRRYPRGNDEGDNMMITRSLDGGLTWEPPQHFGDYGQHYPRVIKLRDGRLMMTFTQRALFYPIGLRAIFSNDDGESWDFDGDHLIISGFTPWGWTSGGGFGNTLELADGTFVSCYSYRGYDDRRHIEVARWRLPLNDSRPYFMKAQDIELATRPDRERSVVLCDWSEDSSLKVDLCDRSCPDKDVRQVRLTRGEFEAGGETFPVELEIFSAEEAYYGWPGVTLSNLPVRDFGDSLSLSVNVHNPTAARQQLSLTIQDANGNYVTQAEDIEPGETKAVFLTAEDVVLASTDSTTSRTDLSNVECITLVAAWPERRSTFLLSPVYLVKESDCQERRDRIL